MAKASTCLRVVRNTNTRSAKAPGKSPSWQGFGNQDVRKDSCNPRLVDSLEAQLSGLPAGDVQGIDDALEAITRVTCLTESDGNMVADLLIGLALARHIQVVS